MNPVQTWIFQGFPFATTCSLIAFMIAMFFPAPNLLTAAHVYDISSISFSSGTDFNPSALSSTPPRTKLRNYNTVQKSMRHTLVPCILWSGMFTCIDSIFAHGEMMNGLTLAANCNI